MKKVDPRKRILVTGDQAVRTKCQHKKPCADCPWARKSVAGWLGGDTPEGWLAAAHGEARIECHTATVQCAGAAIYRANVVKSVRDPDQLRLPADRELVFSTPMEFVAHHST